MNTTTTGDKQFASITQLREWSDNPRNISAKDFERLKGQIKKLGQYKPLLVTTDGEVIGGNMRLKAYRELGITDIWVSIVDPKDNNEKLEYALSDNDRAGYYDDDMLANLIPNYDIDWSQYAVDLKPPEDIQKLIDRIAPAVEDEAPEVEEGEADSKPGTVYQLGRHRLMCGDSTKLEDVEKLMGEQRADMVFTDPPYNIGYEGKTKERLTIENDSMGSEDFQQFLIEAFTNLNVLSKSGAAIYICHADMERVNFQMAMEKSGWLQKECIIWNKNRMVLGRQDYQWQHEPILYGWKKGGTHTFYGGRTKTTVWSIDKPSTSIEHPTMKPIALMVEAINNSSKGDDIILDTFGGSGSTLIACEQTNRSCYTMELDPKYCDVIRKRYSKTIGQEDSWKTVTPPLQQ